MPHYLRLLLPLEPRRWLTEDALRERRSPEDQALVLLIESLRRRRRRTLPGLVLAPAEDAPGAGRPGRHLLAS